MGRIRGRYYEASYTRQSGDNDVVFANSSAGVDVGVVNVGWRCIVLFVEHLLRSRQLDWQRAHPSHRVLVVAQPARHLLLLQKSLTIQPRAALREVGVEGQLWGRLAERKRELVMRRFGSLAAAFAPAQPYGGQAELSYGRLAGIAGGAVGVRDRHPAHWPYMQ
jgi:hypothetical protein